MNDYDFQLILFKVAICSMSCDGVIDDREINLIKSMSHNSIFFSDIDVDISLKSFIDDSGESTNLVSSLFRLIEKSSFDSMQELLILEVAIRIINSDQSINSSEISFINALRSLLSIHDELIFQRFGPLKMLNTNKNDLSSYASRLDINSHINLIPIISEDLGSIFE